MGFLVSKLKQEFLWDGVTRLWSTMRETYPWDKHLSVPQPQLGQNQIGGGRSDLSAFMISVVATYRSVAYACEPIGGRMDQPHTAKAYLSKALAADEQAELCVSKKARTAWKNVATQYRRLAALADRNFPP
jgi:hypothetical protein